MYNTYKSATILLSVAVGILSACSGTATSSSSSGGVLPDDDAGSTPAADASAEPQPDAGSTQKDATVVEQPPTAPMFEVTLNGMAMTVKDVAVKGIPAQQGSIANYELKGTLDKGQAFVAGLQEDATITIEIGKDDQGSNVCKVARGPAQGFIEPVIELRKVTINYKRFTGQSTVYAYPNTNAKDGTGSCSMTLKTAAANGQAWGEAQGKVQAGTDEPVVSFQAKWFQTLKW